eukprot:COSAG01_NODE_16045_length_1275_cov_0.870748_3_plen_57_part_01
MLLPCYSHTGQQERIANGLGSEHACEKIFLRIALSIHAARALSGDRPAVRTSYSAPE